MIGKQMSNIRALTSLNKFKHKVANVLLTWIIFYPTSLIYNKVNRNLLSFGFSCPKNWLDLKSSSWWAYFTEYNYFTVQT